MIPSFNALPIFGSGVTMQTAENPREEQLNAFFGLDGLESLDGGDRGRTTHVRGVLFGPGLVGLNTSQAAFRALKDGKAYPLLDTRGYTWQNVKLYNFQPVGRVWSNPIGVFFQEYAAQFNHLS
jgi:hypothetical protein